ncbi:MAG: antibiotic biosynthesis monooxygenase [Bacteroidales bacterium]|nr:antibiotic biosynthesis monooxygenase [Bacteroidales bacterium]
MKRLIIAAIALAALVSCAPKQNNAPLRLNCLVSVSMDNRDRYIELCMQHVAASLEDEGNIAFDLMESATDSTKFLIFETWESQDALDKHSASQHFADIVPQTGALATTVLQQMQAGVEPEGDFVLRLNCPTTVTEETREAVIELCKELVASSLQDEGNIAYDLFISCSDPCKMLIFETWKDQASLDKHSAAEHFTRLVPQIQELGTLEVESFKLPVSE